MNKTDLIEAIAKDAKLTKKDAEAALLHLRFHLSQLVRILRQRLTLASRRSNSYSNDLKWASPSEMPFFLLRFGLRPRL